MIKNSSILFLLLSFVPGNLCGLIGLSNAKVQSVIVQADGKIVAAGSAIINHVGQAFLVRYNSDGSLDTGFNSTGIVTEIIGDNAEYHGVIQQSDNKLVVVGSASLSTNPQFIVVRYNTDGSKDTSGFGNSGIVTSVQGSSSTANAIAQQSDGKLVITGGSSSPTYTPRFFTARLNGNGTFDTGFNSTGVVFTQSGNSATASAIKIQSDGKIVVAGASQAGFLAMRYTTGGVLDTAGFGSSGIAGIVFGTFAQGTSLAIQSDGKILLGGFSDNNFGVVRLTTAGILDTTFNTTGKVTTAFPSTAEIFSLFIDGSGNLVAAGYMDNQIALARYLTTGTPGALDTSFNPGGSTPGTLTTSIGSMARALSSALQSDGKIIAAGYSSPNAALIRYSATGVVDTGFGSSGTVINPSACSVALCAYGQVFNTAEIDVLNNATVPFNTNGTLVNITHSTSSSTDSITLGLSGTYAATYIVESPSNANLELKLNGTVISSSNYVGQASAIAVGKAIFDANAGDVLTLINISGFDIFLSSGGINASIILEKIA